MLLHPIGNQYPIPFSQSCCQLWLKQKLHNMMFTILSCLIATSQDKVHWIERLSLAEKAVITTCEAYAECQRSFTLRSDNNVCYKWVPGTISRTLHDTSTLKVSQYHRGSKGGTGSCGAWEHVEQRVINSLFPRWPPLSGKLSLHPVLKDAVQGGGHGTEMLFFLPTPSSPAQHLPSSSTQEV